MKNSDKESNKTVIKYTETDLFSATILEWPIKDDLVSMEFPLFSLAKKRDTEVREYISPTSGKKIRVTPSVLGAATVFDKDLLLYIGSQIIEGRRLNHPISRSVHVDIYKFLMGTLRTPSGQAYDLVLDMLRRLKGTSIETNIVTGGVEQTRGFGLIENYAVSRQSKNKNGVLEVNVTISEWLYNALVNYEVLTIPQNYFKLGQALERRLYELARKHTGDKPFWKCNIEIIQQKSGTTQDLRRFRSEIRNIIKKDSLPDYKIALDTSRKPHHIVFYTRDNQALSKELNRLGPNSYLWFDKLERQATLLKKKVNND